ERFAADAESDQPPGRRRAGPRRRSARPLRQIPRISSPAPEPNVTPGELAERQLRDQHRPSRVQAGHYRGIDFEVLRPKGWRPPRGGISAYGQQVLCTPGHSVQWTTILPRGNLLVRCPGLLEGPFTGDC